MRQALVMLLAVGLSWSAMAADVPSAVSDRLARLIPSAKPDSVQPAGMLGLYEVVYGSRILYVSADGRYVLRGDLLDLQVGVNLTEDRRRSARVDAVEKFADSMIVFAPAKPKHTINVFTDVNCGYCAKLHAEMGELNKRGIAVRYLAYPRQGVQSATYKQMVSVWCADDPRAAMTSAKAGRRVDSVTCANKIAEHYRLGEMLGVRGTPTMVLPSGEVVPGYASPDELLKMLTDGVGS